VVITGFAKPACRYRRAITRHSETIQRPQAGPLCALEGWHRVETAHEAAPAASVEIAALGAPG
jgi:hypothetical protein